MIQRKKPAQRAFTGLAGLSRVTASVTPKKNGRPPKFGKAMTDVERTRLSRRLSRMTVAERKQRSRAEQLLRAWQTPVSARIKT